MKKRKTKPSKASDWKKALAALPTPKPPNADKKIVAELKKHFPWADRSTLEWASNDLVMLGRRVVDILSARQSPKHLTLHARDDFATAMKGALIECLAENMKCFIPQVETEDLEQEIHHEEG